MNCARILDKKYLALGRISVSVVDLGEIFSMEEECPGNPRSHRIGLDNVNTSSSIGQRRVPVLDSPAFANVVPAA